jgi:PLP dependent protein
MPASQGRALDEGVGRVRTEIARACERAGRRPDDVVLVAVTKTVPPALIRRAMELGVDHFGENHAGDLAKKAALLEATWHFIGKIQRGTAARIAEFADLVHSGEAGRAFEKLARRAAEEGRELPCLAQVDFTGRRQGTPPDEVEAFLEQGARVEGVRIIGLMTIPPITESPEGARAFFRRLRELRDDLRNRWPQVVELSMGMSLDYTVAIEEGATMVRVGTALFGDRPNGRTVPERGQMPGLDAP